VSSQITGKPEPVLYVVESVDWHRHEKKKDADAPPSVCISYTCYPEERGPGNLSSTVVREWVCFEHEGFARQKAVGWWQTRSIQPEPDTVAGALDLLRRGACRQAARLWVVPEGRWQKIVRVEFNDEIPGELDTIPEPAATGGGENDEDWVPF
jgi:DNA repair protein RadD